ncbi:hypothetical protein [Verrucosispora sp. WMMC514]|uniref:hypothetical protein n=1 Tax=Verrucosispora sp. WMMC514 TaxID=3015156 RepID=UPI00248CF085|nr:hypothetical protein [Verrucosispora sp. WMMC514]WBB93284.1 hypothetical protein O7597_10060 [Verrucosispora sp. WMMC514]
MAILLASIDATPTPGRRMMTIIGGDFDSFGHPETNAAVLCWAGTEQIQLFSEISDGHRPHVTVEAWDGPAPTDTGEWETHGHAELHSTSGTLGISIFDEKMLTPFMPIGAPGTYLVDVHAAGRRQIRGLYGKPAWFADELPTGIERFLVRVWPKHSATSTSPDRPHRTATNPRPPGGPLVAPDHG